MLKPANRQTLHDNVLAQLIHAIEMGQWAPGDKLPSEQELAKQFQVSRNSLREVLKALALANVIEACPGQGTFLTKDALRNLDGGNLASTVWGDASLWDLKEVGSLLEGHIAYLAARRATDEQLRDLERALLPQNLQENLTESHARFHQILSQIAGNPLLSYLLSSVQNKMDTLREKYSRMPRGALDTFTEEHIQIFHMVREHRPEEARNAMLKHIEAAWTDSLYVELKR